MHGIFLDQQSKRLHARTAVQVYDGDRFVKGGFRMHELFFHDGTCPSDAILQAFLRIAEQEPGARSLRASFSRPCCTHF